VPLRVERPLDGGAERCHEQSPDNPVAQLADGFVSNQNAWTDGTDDRNVDGTDRKSVDTDECADGAIVFQADKILRGIIEFDVNDTDGLEGRAFRTFY
jgi:hypothetical protein